MNYMSEVAKMLGVELGEEFEIDFGNGISTAIVYLDDMGLKVKETNMVYMQNAASVFFEWLLAGLCIIKHKPWKPNIADVFWYIDYCGNVQHQQWVSWDNFSFYKIGNCYRTREEAKANRDKWIAFYASDEVLEV